MLTFKADIPDAKRAVILSQLDEIEREEGVRILFAIESGSRAWGFPSPDSDFDVRFVYAHDEDWYLSVYPGRDVIEKPLVDDWDVNGWDIRKAIGLLMKSSPVHYMWNDNAVSALQAFAGRYVTPESCLAHYYHLGARQWDRCINGRDVVNLKKYFYALRPALALRWVRMNPDQLPPMNFQRLVDGTDISEATQARIAELLVRKSRSSEMGAGARVPELDEIIQSEFDRAAATGLPKLERTDELKAEADTLFRKLVRGA